MIIRPSGKLRPDEIAETANRNPSFPSMGYFTTVTFLSAQEAPDSTFTV